MHVSVCVHVSMVCGCVAFEAGVCMFLCVCTFLWVCGGVAFEAGVCMFLCVCTFLWCVGVLHLGR